MPLFPEKLTEDALSAYISPRILKPKDMDVVVSPVFSHYAQYKSLKQEAAALLEQIATTATQCAEAKKADKKIKGVYIDTTRTDTRTCRTDTPRGEGWHTTLVSI